MRPAFNQVLLLQCLVLLAAAEAGEECAAGDQAPTARLSSSLLQSSSVLQPGESLDKAPASKVVVSIDKKELPSDKLPSSEALPEIDSKVFAREASLAGPSMVQKALAEFIAMFIFVIVGCGSACGIAKVDGAAWVLQVSLTFGFAITVLAYTIGHYSGGQINCAVTFGLVLAGQVTWQQGVANLVAQLLGSVCGALVLTVMYPKGKDLTDGLGSNGVGEGWTSTGALLGEILMTFLLMYTVLETAVNPLSAANREQACIAIGLAVFLAHSVLVPIDGCSINPTRSIGPALVAKMRYEEANTLKDMWVFWVGPLVGASLAVGLYGYMSQVA